MNEPPRIDPDKLSFDIFHDLAHHPFTVTCRSQYGGAPRHLVLWWTYRAVPVLARATRCRVGWHRWRDGWSSESGACRLCIDCLREPAR